MKGKGKSKKRRQSVLTGEQGMSLMEVMITMGISGVMMAGTAAYLSNVQKAQRSSAATGEWTLATTEILSALQAGATSCRSRLREGMQQGQTGVSGLLFVAASGLPPASNRVTPPAPTVTASNYPGISIRTNIPNGIAGIRAGALRDGLLFTNLTLEPSASAPSEPFAWSPPAGAFGAQPAPSNFARTVPMDLVIGAVKVGTDGRAGEGAQGVLGRATYERRIAVNVTMASDSTRGDALACGIGNSQERNEAYSRVVYQNGGQVWCGNQSFGTDAAGALNTCIARAQSEPSDGVVLIRGEATPYQVGTTRIQIPSGVTLKGDRTAIIRGTGPFQLMGSATLDGITVEGSLVSGSPVLIQISGNNNIIRNARFTGRGSAIQNNGGVQSGSIIEGNFADGLVLGAAQFAFELTGGAEDFRVADNRIVIRNGAGANGTGGILVGASGTGASIQRIRITGNSIRTSEGVIGTGISFMAAPMEARVEGNKISGFDRSGIRVGVAGSTALLISKNEITAGLAAGTTTGILLQDNQSLVIEDNTINEVNTGILIFGASDRSVIKGNRIYSYSSSPAASSYGIRFDHRASESVIESNIFRSFGRGIEFTSTTQPSHFLKIVSNRMSDVKEYGIRMPHVVGAVGTYFFNDTKMENNEIFGRNGALTGIQWNTLQGTAISGNKIENFDDFGIDLGYENAGATNGWGSHRSSLTANHIRMRPNASHAQTGIRYYSAAHITANYIRYIRVGVLGGSTGAASYITGNRIEGDYLPNSPRVTCGNRTGGAELVHAPGEKIGLCIGTTDTTVSNNEYIDLFYAAMANSRSTRWETYCAPRNRKVKVSSSTIRPPSYFSGGYVYHIQDFCFNPLFDTNENNGFTYINTPTPGPNSNNREATCDLNYKVVGGGCKCENGHQLMESSPSRTLVFPLVISSWRCRCSGSSTLHSAHAICERL